MEGGWGTWAMDVGKKTVQCYYSRGAQTPCPRRASLTPSAASSPSAAFALGAFAPFPFASAAAAAQEGGMFFETSMLENTSALLAGWVVVGRGGCGCEVWPRGLVRGATRARPHR